MNEKVSVTVWTDKERVITDFKKAVDAGMPGLVIDGINTKAGENSITLQFVASSYAGAWAVDGWLEAVSQLYNQEGCQFAYETEVIK